MNPTEPIVLCESLVKIYKIADLEVQALQGLDLVVAPGEMLGIVGASGSGKSTLLNILGGLDRPTAGRVRVDRHDLLKMDGPALNRYRRDTVGFVWQQGTRNLIPYLTAYENVRLPMTLAGRTGRKADERARMLLNAVGLEERSRHHLEQLSGGEQQRVAIAVALVNEPSLLLADEPTGEVDSATAQTIYDAFRSLNRTFGLTTVIVSHDPGIARHVDRVVAVRDGKLASEIVRRSAAGLEAEAHETYQEVAMLDSAGRVQVPKEYLQQFNIKRRVQLDLVDDGILMRPVENDEQIPAWETSSGIHPALPGAAGALHNLWSKIRKGNRRIPA